MLQTILLLLQNSDLGNWTNFRASLCKCAAEITPWTRVTLGFGDSKNDFISKWVCWEHHGVIAGPWWCWAGIPLSVTQFIVTPAQSEVDSQKQNSCPSCSCIQCCQSNLVPSRCEIRSTDGKECRANRINQFVCQLAEEFYTPVLFWNPRQRVFLVLLKCPCSASPMPKVN